jgi:hypothetical protein
MSDYRWNETVIEQEVTYVIEMNGAIIIVEHVPARVNIETGERLFAPDVVERLQQIIRARQTPTKVIETPVFEFTA